MPSLSSADHPSRRRSVFGRGSRKKNPPQTSSSGSQRKIALFRSPSFSSLSRSNSNSNKTRTQSSLYDSQKQPLFSDSCSVTSSETRESAPATLLSTASTNMVTPSCSGNSSMDLTPLRSEVTVLRQQLKDVGVINKRSDLLLGQVKVLEEESHRKDEKLRMLNDRFHTIQTGLSHIDEERIAIQRAIKRLEDEKNQIQEQLDLREQEVLTLVRRCAAQEEKVKESTLLRCKNMELEQEVEQLRKALEQQQADQANLDTTTEELKACQQRLENTKRDHDALANTLQSCLANIKKLTHEKQAWEDERRRLLNRAEVEIEKEKLQHLADMNEMKVQLQARQDKIERLEEFMNDKSMTNLMLRKANSELTKWKIQTTVKLEEHERQIAELTKDNEDKEQELSQVSGNTKSWDSKIEEKQAIITSLEEELNNMMSRSMSLAETVEVLQEENQELEELVDNFQEKVKSYGAWEEERDAMLQFLSVTQNQINELVEEVASLQLHNDTLEEEKLMLEEELNSGSKQDIEHLEKHISDKESNWKQLEGTLRAKISALEDKKQVMQECNDAKLKEAQETIRRLEWTVASRTKEAVALQKDLDEARETEADNLNQIQSLESNLSESAMQCEQSKAEAETLRTTNAEMEEAKDHLKCKVDMLEIDLKAKEAQLVEAQATQSSTNQELSTAASLSESNNVELDKLKQKVMQSTAKLEAAEKQLKKAETRIEQLHGRLQSATISASDAIESKTNIEITLQTTIRKLQTSTTSEMELRNAVDDAKSEIQEFKASVAHLEDALASQQSELETLRSAEKNWISRLDTAQGELQEHKATIAGLQTELEADAQETKQSRAATTAEFESLKGGHEALQAQTLEIRKENLRLREEGRALKATVEKLETSLACKEDEIRDLRLCELKDLEDDISMLKEQLQNKESEMSILVGKLETLSISQLERENEYATEVQGLKSTIRKYEEKEACWLSASDEALQEIKSNAVALQRRNQLLESRVESLRTENEMILTSEGAAVDGKEKAEAALHNEMQLRETKERQLRECQARIEALQNTHNAETTRAEKEREEIAVALNQERKKTEALQAKLASGEEEDQRQEAFLKKTKVNQERAARDRMSSTKGVANAVNVVTPSQSARKIRSAARSRPSSIPAPTSLAVDTSSDLDWSSILEDELSR